MEIKKQNMWVVFKWQEYKKPMPIFISDCRVTAEKISADIDVKTTVSKVEGFYKDGYLFGPVHMVRGSNEEYEAEKNLTTLEDLIGKLKNNIAITKEEKLFLAENLEYNYGI